MSVQREEIVQSFRFHARAAAENGSPLYRELLSRGAADIESGGPVGKLVEGWEGHPILDALPLRVMGAVHALVLGGRAPELAAFYPSTAGVFEAPAAWRAFLEVVDSRAGEIRPRLRAHVQTNEVRRCAALLGGFLTVAETTRLPLRVLEIGASAGLNLLWDRYRYELTEHRWGDPASPVVLQAAWNGSTPRLAAQVEVASRAGCDVAPIDVTDSEQRLRLESFVWPDQPQRLATLRAAVALALTGPSPMAACAAADWLEAQLVTLERGEAAVLFQSVVWWYLSEDEREKVTRLVREAAACASAEAPLAWLRLEPIPKELELRLTLWPPGEDRLLARAHHHGSCVTWLG